MSYTNFTPDGLICEAMFDFDYYGFQNYKFSDSIKVSVSDGFSNGDYYLGLVNSTDFTMNPYSNEIIWHTNVINNLNSTFLIFSQFAKLSFSSVIDYDSSGGGLFSIASPADVGTISDINISFMNANSENFLGISSGSSDLLGYEGSRGDIFINVTGVAFENEGVTFADHTKSRQVLMHEIGHSLGLSHPFDQNGKVKPDYSKLTTAGFEKLGFNINNADLFDKEYFSIMSYDDESSITLINAYTPMILDIIALQNVYGQGLGTTDSSNDTISVGNIGYRSYYDRGGTDSIDLSIYINGAYLHMGTLITSASHQVGIVTSLSDSEKIFSGEDPSALRWLYGEYENATGSNSSDLIIGNNLVNYIYGSAGNDTLNGCAGNDTLDGGTGFDWAEYNTATSFVTVNLATGTSSGGDGADNLSNIEYVSGSSYNDILIGDANNNVLRGGLGNDTLDGGTGFDWAEYNTATSFVTVNLATGTSSGGAGVDNLSNIERVSGSSYNDILTGDANINVLLGGLGNDTLDGGALSAADIIDGGDGNDTVSFASLTSTLSKGVTLNLGSAKDSSGYVSASGLGGMDKVKGVENILGSAYADIFTGDSAANALNGGAGTDFLTGLLGTDSLYGGADKVKDVFDFNTITESKVGVARDKVYDFITKIDKIDLGGIDANTTRNKTGDQAFLFNNTKAKANSVWFAAKDVDGSTATKDIIVYGDVNGDAKADFEIGLIGVTSLTSADFVL